jgi:glycosyltransferase involved in cell wall biosynthesis
MNKQKVLFILHRSPPSHGASKVGEFIASSSKLGGEFDCRFITIRSSDTISEIGRFTLKKIYLVAELYIKVIWALINFKPDTIYFTASIRSVAFYRDLLVSTLWKSYSFFRKADVYYHYHTKGIDQFVSTSSLNLKLTTFFVKNVNLILLSPMLLGDFDKIKSFDKVLYLPNVVENTLNESEFIDVVNKKMSQTKLVNILYLSNMIKSKGYFRLLELATKTKGEDICYHFAGGWLNDQDSIEFHDYIIQNNLSDTVKFHGFVNGNEKRLLLESAHLFAFPTRYQNEAFPLSILEALSYGVPVISTDEGSIPYILDSKCGVILTSADSLFYGLEQAKNNLINEETSFRCRQRYLENFSLNKFECNLIKILSEK